MLLGTYLKAQGLGTFQYVVGMRGAYDERHSHAWIEAGGVIIDITADQFPCIGEKVIVSEQSGWHETFEREVRHEADYRLHEGSNGWDLDRAYLAIVEMI